MIPIIILNWIYPLKLNKKYMEIMLGKNTISPEHAKWVVYLNYTSVFF